MHNIICFHSHKPPAVGHWVIVLVQYYILTLFVFIILYYVQFIFIYHHVSLRFFFKFIVMTYER